MFTLITSYYHHSGNEERQMELKNSLINNAKNQYIKTIFLLNDCIYDINFVPEQHRHKIVQMLVNSDNKNRLHFDCAIQFVNNFVFGEKCIVSNADIYFDDTLKYIENYDFDNVAFALTKHNDGVLNPVQHCSQDSWIFTSPLRVDMSLLHFQFGIVGCDNIFAGVLEKSGYNVINPCLTVVANHLHKSESRPTYEVVESLRIHGYYHYVYATEL